MVSQSIVLKSGWRQLFKDPAYAVISVGGLAVALASVLLAIAFVQTSLGGDDDVPAGERVVRIEGRVNAPGADPSWQLGAAPPPLQDGWKGSGAPVAFASRYVDDEVSVRLGERLLKQTVSYVDPPIVDVFGLRSRAGDLRAALARPDTLALSESTARRWFGRADVLGQRVAIFGKLFSVAAVLPDRPATSALRSDVLLNLEALPPGRVNMTWNGIRPQTFVRLSAGGSGAQVAAQGQRLYEASPSYQELPAVYRAGPLPFLELRAVPLAELPLSGAESEGRRRLVGALGLAAAMILALAAINFTNLGTVRTLSRQREIGMRKALGASPRRVAAQFMAEAALAVALATLLGLLMAWLAAPLLGELLETSLDGALLAPRTLLWALPVCGLLALFTGAYPAWVAWKMDCAQALAGRGQVESRTGLWVRRALTASQFAAALGLSTLTLVVWWQSHYLMALKPGFDAAPLLAVETPINYRDPRLAAFEEAASHLPGVASVGLSWDVLGRGYMVTTADLTNAAGQPVTLAYQLVGAGTLQTYGVQPLAGRLFEHGRDKQGEAKVVVINELALPLLGFRGAAQAVGQRVGYHGGQAEIIGVIPAIRERGLRQAARPVLYTIDWSRAPWLTLRATDTAQARAGLATLWPRFFPDQVLEVRRVQAVLDEQFEPEHRLAALIGLASLIALLLAGCGVYALAAHTVRRRSREIVLRKLHGARHRDIALLLGREFASLATAGALVGLPLAWWASRQYQSGFIETAALGPWPVAAALAVGLLVMALAVLRHSRAALALPPMRALQG